MSGAWAREADAKGAHLLPEVGLARAAKHLAFMLETDDHWLRSDSVILASAIIRRERKRLDPEGKSLRKRDWDDTALDYEGLLWYALCAVALAANAPRVFDDEVYVAHQLREAESALRTLHKRGQS